jgi:hypothetical protein
MTYLHFSQIHALFPRVKLPLHLLDSHNLVGVIINRFPDAPIRPITQLPHNLVPITKGSTINLSTSTEHSLNTEQDISYSIPQHPLDLRSTVDIQVTWQIEKDFVLKQILTSPCFTSRLWSGEPLTEIMMYYPVISNSCNAHKKLCCSIFLLLKSLNLIPCSTRFDEETVHILSDIRMKSRHSSPKRVITSRVWTI